jgi:biotin carboxylase
LRSDSGDPKGAVAAKVLLLASARWVSTARLSLALTSFGCEVELMAQRNHPALQAGVVARSYRYDVLRPVESILRAIRASQPDIVIPVDELTVLHVEELRIAAESSSGEDQGAVLALLATSGDRAETMALGRSRRSLLKMAADLGVPIPDTIPVNSEQELAVAVGELGLPLALKADATFGGRGVRLVSSAEEAARAWKKLHSSSSFLAALRRGLVWREWSYVREWAHGMTRDVAAQRLVRGKERTALAVAIDGEVKAAVCLEVIQTAEHLGPSSVLRVVEDETMMESIHRVAKGAGVSGFCGFDFMVDPTTGTPLLIEMNLRPTQLVHLPLGPGRDLIAAYLRGMLGLEVEDRPAATDQEFIALFPQELVRDPNSGWVQKAFLDVPWNAPDLVRVALKGKVPEVISGDARYSAAR